MKKGFTLIELLVVVSIIGVLSTIVIGALSGAREKAREARAFADMKQIEKIIVSAHFEAGIKTLEISEGSALPGHKDPINYCFGGGFFANGHCGEHQAIWQEHMIAVGGLDLDPIINDPWGFPYVVDVNEALAHPSCNPPDLIMSTKGDSTFSYAEYLAGQYLVVESASLNC